jgi:hypothetical protein
MIEIRPVQPADAVSPAAHAALGYAEVERYFRKELRAF